MSVRGHRGRRRRRAADGRPPGRPRGRRAGVRRARRAGCPGWTSTCANRIPHGGGQGSSAAAIVAGLLLAPRPARRRRRPAARRATCCGLAAAMEGHPDNVAPALLGGFTMAWSTGTDGPRGASAASAPGHPGGGVHRAHARRPPRHARALLPATVPHADAAANAAAAAALLVHALTDRPDLPVRRHRGPAAPAATGRRPCRSRPRWSRDLRAAGIAAVISGAGPSVLVVETADVAPDRHRAVRARRVHQHRWPASIRTGRSTGRCQRVDRIGSPTGADRAFAGHARGAYADDRPTVGGASAVRITRLYRWTRPPDSAWVVRI